MYPCTIGHVNELIDLLHDRDSLVIVCHDNPDPDSIASAAALEWIAERIGVSDVRILFGGSISHHQNRALVRHLGADLTPLAAASLTDSDLVAFVDHAVPGEHTQLSPEIDVDVVIDHHEHVERIRGDFVDLRPEYGATTTILVEYLFELEYQPPTELASMLLFALHRERLDHVRNPTSHEYEAALFLLPHVDRSIIEQLYSAQFSPSTVDTIGEAIRNRRVRGSCLVSWVGPVSERDALPQAANYLVNLQDVDTVLAFGWLDGEIHPSARSEDPNLRLDSVIREVVGSNGHGGGHEGMAGGVISVDRSLVQGADDSALVREVVVPVTERFFAAAAAGGQTGRS